MGGYGEVGEEVREEGAGVMLCLFLFSLGVVRIPSTSLSVCVRLRLWRDQGNKKEKVET